jgi:hypothetical protein
METTNAAERSPKRLPKGPGKKITGIKTTAVVAAPPKLDAATDAVIDPSSAREGFSVFFKLLLSRSRMITAVSETSPTPRAIPDKLMLLMDLPDTAKTAMDAAMEKGRDNPAKIL